MVKRSVVIVLMLLYVVTVSGFALNLHYCFNRLASVAVDTPAGCVKKQATKWKCCSDKHFEVKVKDAHQNSSSSFLAKILSFALPQSPLTVLNYSIQNDRTNRQFDHGPPQLPGCSIYLKNCSFRI